MVDFRTCAICGGTLEGPGAEQRVVEHRRVAPAQGAVHQREVPRDLNEEEVCADCLRKYRREIGMSGPPDEPAE